MFGLVELLSLWPGGVVSGFVLCRSEDESFTSSDASSLSFSIRSISTSRERFSKSTGARRVFLLPRDEEREDCKSISGK